MQRSFVMPVSQTLLARLQRWREIGEIPLPVTRAVLRKRNQAVGPDSVEDPHDGQPADT